MTGPCHIIPCNRMCIPVTSGEIKYHYSRKTKKLTDKVINRYMYAYIYMCISILKYTYIHTYIHIYIYIIIILITIITIYYYLLLLLLFITTIYYYYYYSYYYYIYTCTYTWCFYTHQIQPNCSVALAWHAEEATPSPRCIGCSTRPLPLKVLKAPPLKSSDLGEREWVIWFDLYLYYILYILWTKIGKIIMW
jgi:hypothetical protein